MSADTLETYRHSGKFNAAGPVLALGAAAVAAVPLGLAYSYLIRWVPFIYLNMLATCAYGCVFGWMTMRLLKAGHVRNTTLAALVGFGAGLLALYGEWSGHLRVLTEDAPWLFGPDEILRGMQVLYEQGSWGMKSGGNVTGIELALVWVGEAGLIVGFATLLPYGFVMGTPYCEKSRCWLEEEKKINTLERISDPAQLAALKAGDIMPVVSAKPKPDGAGVYTRLWLKRSPQCPVFCTLRVQDITVTVDKKGKLQESAKDLTGDLIIPASMFELIAQFEHFKPEPPAPA
jgi:hypothetical protein